MDSGRGLLAPSRCTYDVNSPPELGSVRLAPNHKMDLAKPRTRVGPSFLDSYARQTLDYHHVQPSRLQAPSKDTSILRNRIYGDKDR